MKTIKIRKKTIWLGIFILSLLVTSSFFVLGFTFPETESSQGADVFRCPTQQGTCNAGTWKCIEDLGRRPYHACEYHCGDGGTWGAGNVCSYNMCHGGQCAASRSESPA